MYIFAVCDDEPEVAKYIADFVQLFFDNYRIRISIDRFSNSKELQERLQKQSCYDVLLMDIDMPETNGIDICREFRRNGGNSLVVFISNKEELVFQSFDVQPFRFVRKRRFKEEIYNLCTALMSELEKRIDMSIRIEDIVDGTVVSVAINSLVYVEARGKKCMLKSQDKTIEVRIQFQQLLKKLNSFSFIQIHRSYLVNPRYIYRINKESVMLDGGEELPISRRRREQIKEEYFRWSR